MLYVKCFGDINHKSTMTKLVRSVSTNVTSSQAFVYHSSIVSSRVNFNGNIFCWLPIHIRYIHLKSNRQWISW